MPPLCALLLAGCGENAGDLPTDFTDRGGLERELVSVALRPSSHASVVGERANGNAFAVHVGQNEGVRAAGLFHFPLADSSGAPYLSEGDTLIEATLSFATLRRRPLVGDQVVEVWAVCGAWDEDSLRTTNEAAPTVVDDLICGGIPLGEAVFSAGDTSTATVPMALDDAKEWMNDPSDNLGVALLPVGDPAMSALSSITAAAPAHLTLVVRNEGRSRIFSVLPDQDTYAVAISDPAAFDDPSARITVQNGLARRGLMEFDLSSIPARATVLSAKLVLIPDAGGTWGFNPGFGLEVHEAEAENWRGSFTNLEGDAFPGTTVDLFELGELLLDSLAMNVQVPVQRWVNEPETNRGFLFRTTAEVGDVSYVSFFAGDAPVDSLPRLEIQYVTAGEGRFGGGGS
ncbi:MAG: hypothetical protein CME06_14720 [Gemmatimonadetes bacterium]|nr:hypothetical protein [Gemmatimonadota bacterium]